jgi:methylase of polypeptide subunit release factors
MEIDSDTGDFYKYLEKYRPPVSGATRVGEHVRTASDMFKDTKFFFKSIFEKPSVDVVFRSEIPYQIFLIRRSNGSKKCVLLLNGKEAIKKNLPSGGFVSEDPSFIKLIEDSVKALVGADHDPYALRHHHTKQIIQQGIRYAQHVMEKMENLDGEATADPKKVRADCLETFEMSGVTITLWPFVFDPRAGESAIVMVDALRPILDRFIRNNKKPTVFDIGCGCGLLGIIAAQNGAAKVYAIDHNAWAVSCTEYNFDQNSVSGKVLRGNLFEPIDKHFPETKADLIVADLPFLDHYPCAEDPNVRLLQTAFYDFEQKKNIAFLKEAGKYLTVDGVVLLSFSNLDSVSEFRNLVERLGWHIVENGSREVLRNGYRWYAFQLVKPGPP